ncbi:MAG: ammonia-forming cytochrome c nitrite reductase subunit c552 [Anaerolineae bacterium]|nr:ammonia-forming cytochrome c nitrite reductase subunit c552 [Anaerolineae bacterium]
MSKTARRAILLFALFGLVLVGVGVGALLTSVTTRQVEALQYPLKVVEIGANEIDPEVWGKNFPLHYDRFMMTQQNYGQTPYGGSDVYSKLERYPAMIRIWAGYAFSIDHNEERGHYYAQIDQENTQRVKAPRNQPGACINCHAAEAPQLIADMGWAEFNRTPYNDLVDQLHTGSSCADCHDPEDMSLRLTRPGLINALEANGIDWTQASRQEMRSYVCAQCHVEYYFAGDDKLLTFPWTEGATVAEGTNRLQITMDNIEAYYDAVGFTDWTHAETSAPMLKMQHPEYEMYSSSLHARAGVACADCHMPYIREGGLKISDHWVRSPLVNINTACQTCHNFPEQHLQERILIIQDNTAQLLRDSEHAILDAIDAIVAAKDAGATDEQLAEAYQMHRLASMRWDFVSSENSTGFHNPQEAARILAGSIDAARQAQLLAVQVLNGLGDTQTTSNTP